VRHKEKQMKTIDRLHHVCLTVSSENFEEVWPKELAFFADFLGMNCYKNNILEMDEKLSLQGIEQGLGLGPQTPVIFTDDGRAVLDHFYYIAGEDMSETACLIDLIVFLCEPGQLAQPQPNMYTQGLRGLTLLTDNIDAVYQRGLDMGIEFLSAPTKQDWGSLGEVRFSVAKDAMDNPVELVQTDEVTEPGDGKILRIFSINQNTADLQRTLDFYCDGCGMTVAAEVSHQGEAFAKSVDVSGAARATTCFLKGTNPEAKTYFALTSWDEPALAPFALKDRYTASFYRMWHWVKGHKADVQALWDQMEPKMKQPTMAPYSYPSVRPWSDVTMSFFIDDDGVHQEFANHAEGGWGGLEEMVDHPEFSKRFGVFER